MTTILYITGPKVDERNVQRGHCEFRIEADDINLSLAGRLTELLLTEGFKDLKTSLKVS